MSLTLHVQVAEFLGTVHHSYTYTLEEGLDAIKEVIWHLETYDVTTIRAATPMYLMSRKVRGVEEHRAAAGLAVEEGSRSIGLPRLAVEDGSWAVMCPLSLKCRSRPWGSRWCCQAKEQTSSLEDIWYAIEIVQV